MCVFVNVLLLSQLIHSWHMLVDSKLAVEYLALHIYAVIDLLVEEDCVNVISIR